MRTTARLGPKGSAPCHNTQVRLSDLVVTDTHVRGFLCAAAAGCMAIGPSSRPVEVASRPTRFYLPSANPPWSSRTPPPATGRSHPCTRRTATQPWPPHQVPGFGAPRLASRRASSPGFRVSARGIPLPGKKMKIKPRESLQEIPPRWSSPKE